MVKASTRTTGDLAVKMLLTVTVCTVLTAAQSPDSGQLQGIDDGRQWFARARPTPTPPPILRAAAGGKTARPDSTDSNLVFFRNHLLLRALVLGKPVFATFDTGAVTTDLNGNFATEFAELVQRTGTRDTQSITGVGGTTAVEAIKLPSEMPVLIS